jgi:serine/threonine protein kinase
MEGIAYGSLMNLFYFLVFLPSSPLSAGEMDGAPFLVTELMTRGSLRGILANASLPLPVALRLRMALDTSQGMAFLHTFQPHPMIHRDLKSQNLLVSDLWIVKAR